jgi:hypothetical protein
MNMLALALLVLLVFIAYMVVVAHKLRMRVLRDIQRMKLTLHNEEVEQALVVLEDLEMVFKD